MKKINILVIGLVLAAFTLPAQAQFNMKNKASLHQRLIEQTIMKNVAVVEHSYQLYDSTRHIVMGRGESEVYGHTYSLGVIVNEAIVVPTSYSEPWKYDESYKPKENYVPRSYQQKIRSVYDTVFNSFTIDSSITNLGNSLSLIPFDTKFGFNLDIVPGGKDGFYVLFSAQQPIEAQPSEKVNCILVEKKFETTAGKTSYDMEVPPPRDTLIGGLYLVPCTDKYGVLSFNLVGMLQKIDGKWTIITFTL